MQSDGVEIAGIGTLVFGMSHANLMCIAGNSALIMNELP
jgi:hypothetical protein